VLSVVWTLLYTSPNLTLVAFKEIVHSTKQLAHDENTGLVVMCNLHLTQNVIYLFNAWVTNA